MKQVTHEIATLAMLNLICRKLKITKKQIAKVAEEIRKFNKTRWAQVASCAGNKYMLEKLWDNKHDARWDKT